MKKEDLIGLPIFTDLTKLEGKIIKVFELADNAAYFVLLDNLPNDMGTLVSYKDAVRMLDNKK